ncbi:unnamed protein product [Arctogadus glacialis]
MGGWSRAAVLALYRSLLRAGRRLTFTDRDFYHRAVAREFRRCQALTAPADREAALRRGQFFLSSRLGGLMAVLMCLMVAVVVGLRAVLMCLMVVVLRGGPDGRRGRRVERRS